MTAEDFRNGMYNLGSFIEKLFKVLKDAYLFIKEQLEDMQK